MTFKYLLWFILISGPGGIAFSQQMPEGNSRIAERLIAEGITSLTNKLMKLGDDKLYVFLFDDFNPEADYIAQNVRSGLQGFKVIWGEKFDSADYVLTMKNAGVDIDYLSYSSDNIVGTKRLERLVRAGFDVYVTVPGNAGAVDSVIFSRSNRSYVDAQNLSFIEDSGAPFLSDKLPDEGAVSSVVVPAVMIGLSAAAIILFFTIRSK